MISKGSRVNTKEVSNVIKNGKSLSSPFFSIRFLVKSGLGSPKFGAIASKKLFHRAVDRNFVRRRFLNALKKMETSRLKDYLVIFLCKKESFSVKFSILEKEIALKLNQISKN